MASQLRVGLVGVNAGRSWAKDSHIPALRSLPEFRIAAVATRKMTTATEAAEAFGALEAYDDFRALVRSDQVDVVSVSVRVPSHMEVVTAALEAGKHVICEWPLGRNVDEADKMAAMAREAGVHVCIGLQGRMSPAARRAAQLVRDGRIGRPLTASVYSPNGSYGPRFLSDYAYLMDPANGANLTAILGGHTMDLAISILGGFRHVATQATIMFEDVELTDPPGRIRRETPDHLFIQARCDNGCSVGIEVAGNRPAGSIFSFKIVGTEGELTLTGGHQYGYQSSDLKLEGTFPFDPPEPHAASGLEGSPISVAELYRAFGRDILTGSRSVRDFDHAAQLTRLVRAVRLAGETGERQINDGWPTE
jgi:predicted dehydrogenase